MAEKKEDQYKLFTRLSAADRDILDWLSYKTKKSRQDLIEPVITAAIHSLAKQYGWVEPVVEEADEDDEEKPPPILKAAATKAKKQKATITETAAVQSDPALMAALEQSEADVAAGRVLSLAEVEAAIKPAPDIPPPIAEIVQAVVKALEPEPQTSPLQLPLTRRPSNGLSDEERAHLQKSYAARPAVGSGRSR